MTDVNPIANAPQSAPVEPETTAPVPQQENQTASTSAPAVPERTIPYERFSEVAKERSELKRRLAEFENAKIYQGYDPNDTEAVLSHPIVQDLMIKQAKYELTDYTKEHLDQYPQLPDWFKRSILKNVRGFVKESTQDVETAKLDIDEYLEEVISEFAKTNPNPNQPKTFPVASTNAPTTESASQPADVAKILKKPVDEWTDKEAKMVDDYKKSLPRK